MGFSQMTGRDGLWTSTTCTTDTVSGWARNPKLAASGEEPSRITTAPLPTLALQSAEAGVFGGAIKMSADAGAPAMCPTDDRIAGHELGCGPRTANMPAGQSGLAASRR